MKRTPSARRRGRPSLGTAPAASIVVRLPPELLARIEKLREQFFCDRSETVKLLIARGLSRFTL